MLVFIWLNVLFLRPQGSVWHADVTAPPAWQEVMTWDFADGEFPGGWGWGSRRLSPDFLELTGGPDQPAVYVVPVKHGPDYLLTAEVMLVASNTGTAGCVHLMTRDLGGQNHLSGAVLCAGSNSISVYHQINRHDYLLDIAPIDTHLESGRWHRLRLTCAHGAVTIHVDGQQVFAAAGPFPPGFYAEPYLAAEGGTVRVRGLQVLEAATSGVENAAGGGS